MTCDPFRILKITDGTLSDAGIRNEVNLLAETSGFCITEWEPTTAIPKGGGVWSDSPLTDGRRLRYAKVGNVIESMTLEVQDWNADALITDIQALRRLLEKARAWGTSRWQKEPVWIEAQGIGETNLRYAIIADYRTPRDGNPYDQPFWQRLARAGMSDFQLTLERRPYWTDNEPGTGTATEISAVETYDGRNLGNVDSTGARDPTTTEEVYVANKRNEANLTDGYVDDGGVFGVNLMDAALPFAFLPAVPAVNDAVYFGIDTTVANSGPFCSLVFDISTAIVQVTTIAWEYWNGAWAALTVQDNTNANGAMTGVAFDTTGVNSVHWEQPANWATRDLSLDGGPAITGYWVRARVTAIGGAPTAPLQQNRDIYSIIWPYTEIQEGASGGDVTAVARSMLTNQAYNAGHILYDLSTTQALVGLRSLSRGSNYTAYINVSDEQNPIGITVTPSGGVSVVVANVRGPTGRNVRYSAAGVAALASRVQISFASASIAQEYIGAFHVFLRVSQTGGIAGAFTVQLAWDAIGALTSRVIPVNSTSEFEYLDFGVVTIPLAAALETGDEIGTFTVDILAGNSNAAPGTLDFFDIIMLPVDEWAIDCSITAATDPSLLLGYMLDIDSVLSFKVSLRTLVRFTNDIILGVWLGVSAGEAIVQANANQRLWFVTTNVVAGNKVSPPEMGHTIQEQESQRYISMRGDR